jgi:hypothetical protein
VILGLAATARTRSGSSGRRNMVICRVLRTVGNWTGSAGSRWNWSGPVHEPVRFPIPNRAYIFYSHQTGNRFTGRFFWFVGTGVGAVWEPRQPTMLM